MLSSYLYRIVRWHGMKMYRIAGYLGFRLRIGKLSRIFEVAGFYPHHYLCRFDFYTNAMDRVGVKEGWR